MKILTYVIIALGLFEIVSNLYHISKGRKDLIGKSAKRQHQELSSALDDGHFYVKAVIMFIFGILFTASGLVALSGNSLLFLFFVLTLFAIYGLAQAVYYKRPYKVWMSLIVYLLPLLFLIFLY